MTRILLIIIAMVVALLVGSGLLASHYHDNAVTFKEQRDRAKDGLKLANDTIDDIKVRQRDVAALDAKYTKELADANTENDRLRAKLAAGGRVRVAGECKPQSPTAGSVGNAGNVELSPVAGSNVLSIRAGIISDQAKVRYLQQYIVEQCK